MKHNCLKLLTIIFVISLTTSCNLFRTQEPITSPHYEQNSQITSWDLIGKVSIKDNNINHSFNLDWQQRDDVFIITISNILGFQVMQLTGDNSLVELEINANIPAKGVYKAPKLADLDIPNFYFNLPFDELKYWIRGIGSPQSFFEVQTDNSQQIMQINQNDYLIAYKKLHNYGKYNLPQRFKITHHQHLSEINFALKNWQLDNLQEISFY